MRAAGEETDGSRQQPCPAHTSALSLQGSTGPHAPAGTCVLLRGLPPAEEPAQLPRGWKCSRLLPPTAPNRRPGVQNPSSLSPWWDHSEGSVLCESQCSCRGIRLQSPTVVAVLKTHGSLPALLVSPPHSSTTIPPPTHASSVCACESWVCSRENPNGYSDQ